MSTRYWLDRAQWLEHDRRWAQTLNRAAASPHLLLACRIASRLGDGVLWYATMIVLALVAGREGLECAEQMFLAGAVSLAVYKSVKRLSSRERPYLSCPDVRLRGHVLDRFSFPSGHTLHAVGFSLVLAYHFPVVALALLPVTVLIAVSRIVLGLHYPSDVLAGAVFGVAIGLVSMWLI